MPEAPSVNWDMVKELYLQGYSQPEICAQHGVSLTALRKQIVRHGWSKIKRAQRKPAPTAQSQALTHTTDGINTTVVSTAVSLLQSLTELNKPKTSSEIKTRAQALLTALSASHKALGVDGKESGPSAVHYHLYCKDEPVAAAGVVVDVDAVDVEASPGGATAGAPQLADAPAPSPSDARSEGVTGEGDGI